MYYGAHAKIVPSRGRGAVLGQGARAGPGALVVDGGGRPRSSACGSGRQAASYPESCVWLQSALRSAEKLRPRSDRRLARRRGTRAQGPGRGARAGSPAARSAANNAEVGRRSPRREAREDARRARAKLEHERGDALQVWGWRSARRISSTASTGESTCFPRLFTQCPLASHPAVFWCAISLSPNCTSAIIADSFAHRWGRVVLERRQQSSVARGLDHDVDDAARSPRATSEFVHRRSAAEVVAGDEPRLIFLRHLHDRTTREYEVPPSAPSRGPRGDRRRLVLLELRRRDARRVVDDQRVGPRAPDRRARRDRRDTDRLKWAR